LLDKYSPNSRKVNAVAYQAFTGRLLTKVNIWIFLALPRINNFQGGVGLRAFFGSLPEGEACQFGRCTGIRVVLVRLERN
jgi:hypothetical protein